MLLRRDHKGYDRSISVCRDLEKKERKMRAYERLLSYVVIHTTSNEEAETTPSTKRQFDLANILVKEMKELGIEDASMLPPAETPEHTEGREGFYHLTDIRGDVETAEIAYIVRDHDAAFFASKQETLRRIEKTLNEKYGSGTVALTITEQYLNMIEKIRPHMLYR